MAFSQSKPVNQIYVFASLALTRDVRRVIAPNHSQARTKLGEILGNRGAVWSYLIRSVEALP